MMFQLTSVGYKYASLLTNTKQESWLGNFLDLALTSNHLLMLVLPGIPCSTTKKIREELFPHESGSDNYWSHIFMDSESVMHEIRQMIAYFVYYW